MFFQSFGFGWSADFSEELCIIAKTSEAAGVLGSKYLFADREGSFIELLSFREATLLFLELCQIVQAMGSVRVVGG